MGGIILTVSFDFVKNLKKALQTEFSVYLHFHDACGGQYFTLEQTSDDIKSFIYSYLQKQNMTAVFTDDNLQFTVTEKK